MSEELKVVMEVGVFEELDIDDPTEVDTKKKKKDLEELIQESIDMNLNK